MTRDLQSQHIGAFEVITDLSLASDTESGRRFRELEHAMEMLLTDHGYVTVPPPDRRSTNAYSSDPFGVLTTAENCEFTDGGAFVHKYDLAICAHCGKRLHSRSMDELIMTGYRTQRG